MLQKFLKENRDSILQRWIDQTIDTYEPEMVRFLKKEKNQFSNPVRNTIITSLERIYDGILAGNGVDIDEYHGLEEIIKVRAVQDFSPSDALSFLFNLKKIIRMVSLKSEQKPETVEELYDIDERFDTLFKRAFDLYNNCRLKIQEIKMAEIKSRSERVFEMLQKKNK
jgi:hypothetical protein